MQRHTLAAAAAVLLLGSACGGPGDKSAEDLEGDISEVLQDDGLTAEQADCLSAVIVDEVGTEGLQDIGFDDEEPSAELQEQFAQAALAATDECDLDPASSDR